MYGPRDLLFLPSLLEAAGSGKLRIFGDGENLISFCHVDNYCHGLICGYEALYEGSPALGTVFKIRYSIFWFGFFKNHAAGKYYVITDGPPIKLWHVLNQAVVAMGFADLFSKFKLPGWFIMALAFLALWIGNFYATITGKNTGIQQMQLRGK